MVAEVGTCRYLGPETSDGWWRPGSDVTCSYSESSKGNVRQLGRVGRFEQPEA